MDYKIIGDDLQMIEIELKANETIIAEAGMMNWMENSIKLETKLGDGSESDKGMMNKLFNAGKRVLMGESLFMTHFTNESNENKYISFASPYPGKIIPLNMKDYNNEIICQKDAFICASLGTKLDIEFSKKIGRGLFGNEGFIMEKITGKNNVFLQAGGTIIEKKLNNEKILIDTGCIVAYTPGIDFDIERIKGIKNMMFGGEGLFLATLEGTGSIFLQSLPFSRLADRILANAPSVGGKNTGEGSILPLNIFGD